MFADGFGIHAKLIGKLLPDPRTGQVTVAFDELPQLPLEEFEMHVFASDRGIFATPTQCAVYAVETHLYPVERAFAGPEMASSASASPQGPGGKPCPGEHRPFNPKLEAGTPTPTPAASPASP